MLREERVLMEEIEVIKIVDNRKEKFGKHIYESSIDAQCVIDELIAVCEENNIPYDFDMADLPYDMTYTEYQKFVENDGWSIDNIYKRILKNDVHGVDMVADLDTAKELLKMLISDRCRENFTKDIFKTVSETLSEAELGSKANERIELLVEGVVDARKQALGNGNCPYYSCKRRCSENDISCEECTVQYFDEMRDELLKDNLL